MVKRLIGVDISDERVGEILWFFVKTAWQGGKDQAVGEIEPLRLAAGRVITAYNNMVIRGVTVPPDLDQAIRGLSVVLQYKEEGGNGL